MHETQKSVITRREMLIGVVALLIATGWIYQKIIVRPEDSRLRYCSSNLRQIGFAIMQYGDDFDDTYPRAWFGENAGPSDAKVNYKWMDAIFPYVKDEKYFVCPSDGVNEPYHFRSGTNYGSYVVNDSYSKPGDKFSPPTGRKTSKVHKMTALVMDGKTDFRFSWKNINDAPTPKFTDEPFALNTIDSRHNYSRTPITLWAHGLVQSYSVRQVSAPKNINSQNIYTGFTIEDD